MHARWMALALFGIAAAAVQAASFQVTVTAGDRDHGPALVSATAPEGLPQMGRLRNAAGQSGAVFQRAPDGRMVFVSPELKRGATVVFQVEPADNPYSDEWSALARNALAESMDGNVYVDLGGRKVFKYQGAKKPLPRADIKPIYARGGYIHPILSPSGKQITDDFPPNHVHHHGLWTPWTKTVFEGRTPDFWNMGEGTGTVEGPRQNPQAWSGPVQAGFTTRHRFIDLTAPEPKTALNETWQVSACHIPGANYFMIDLAITQECATASALRLPKYHYGGLGLRGNWAWNGTNNCLFLTANGETNRVSGNETTARWCHMGGVVDGGLTGIAVLCHPDNFRAPQGMRLHPSEPFFCYAPSQGGDWAIEPGRPYIARYRFIVQDGPPRRDELDRMWAEFAHPPQAVVQKVQAAED